MLYTTQHTLKSNLYDRRTRKGMSLNIYIEDDLSRFIENKNLGLVWTFHFGNSIFIKQEQV